MKKLLLSSILGLTALALWAAPSHAWCYFGLIPHHCCCGHGKCCCLPYNAFSPNPCCCNPCCCCGNYGGFPACGPGGCPAGPIGETLPGCDGATTAPVGPVQSVPQPTPAPAVTPGPVSQALPYGGPMQAAGAYGYAPMLPPTVMPMGGQPYYYGAYGR
jgi:hypothetical protein